MTTWRWLFWGTPSLLSCRRTLWILWAFRCPLCRSIRTSWSRRPSYPLSSHCRCDILSSWWSLAGFLTCSMDILSCWFPLRYWRSHNPFSPKLVVRTPYSFDFCTVLQHSARGKQFYGASEDRTSQEIGHSYSPCGHLRIQRKKWRCIRWHIGPLRCLSHCECKAPNWTCLILQVISIK